MPKRRENMTLEELEAQRANIAAAIKAKRRQDRTQTRKDNDARKIVAGAIVLKHMEHDEAFKAQITALFERFAIRSRDRQLLGLADQGAQQPVVATPPSDASSDRASQAPAGTVQSSTPRFPHSPNLDNS